MGSIQDSSPSFFENAQYIPVDAIFQVTKDFLADPDPRKVNLGPGTYRDEKGQPWILPSVRMATTLVSDCGHEYLPIAGSKVFREEGVQLVFNGTKPFSEGRIASCQGLSGTGALYLAGQVLRKVDPSPKAVYITDPTWPNHDLLFSSMGFDVKYLPYYKDKSFDFEGYMSVLVTAPPGSIIILHSCAHNPTGCDPSKEQWKKIASVIQERHLFPIFDSAYLGFNSGSVNDDTWAIKYFVDELGLEASICLSFAKSMGLYGERIGLVTFVTKSLSQVDTMNSILENAQRATVSTPPKYGAEIAAAVLSTPDISEQWSKDLITMSTRIKSMREKFYEELVRLDTPGDWSHMIKQTGMFGFTGISPAQITHLQAKYHIYMANTSRISIAGLNDGNFEYVAAAIDDAVRNIH
ncbi:Aspartate aminotransferase, cytoplasmic [Lachnellula occidentalis]|uniref:Aspartate aminotransferase n=1 Tax=Lachnellula occidentalis TaxID=215460 RepID=A0A8H8U5R6_9HELO|nr:Aspartate aminotransferase, cytoplasmic [Lachnellula occidentalis]